MARALNGTLFSRYLDFRRPDARMDGIAWRGLRHLERLALCTSGRTLLRQLGVRNVLILLNTHPQVLFMFWKEVSRLLPGDGLVARP